MKQPAERRLAASRITRDGCTSSRRAARRLRPRGGGQDRRRELPAHLPSCSRLKVGDTDPTDALALAAHRGGFSGSSGDPSPVSSDAARSHPMLNEPPRFRDARHPIGTLGVLSLQCQRWTGKNSNSRSPSRGRRLILARRGVGGGGRSIRGSRKTPSLFHGGPVVRIRLPPAESRLRTPTSAISSSEGGLMTSARSLAS